MVSLTDPFGRILAFLRRLMDTPLCKFTLSPVCFLLVLLTRDDLLSELIKFQVVNCSAQIMLTVHVSYVLI
jgi:hypothetical protein